MSGSFESEESIFLVLLNEENLCSLVVQGRL